MSPGRAVKILRSLALVEQARGSKEIDLLLKGGEGAGRELLLELWQLGTARSKGEGEGLETWVVPDDHRGTGRIGQSAKALEQLLCGGGVVLGHQFDH